MSAEPYSKVLLVDDEPDFLFSACITLRAAGIEPVHSIADSRNVLSYLAESGAAVLVLDLGMPHLSGVELLPRIREQHPQIPVVVLTGTVGVETAVGCMKAGAFDYLVKPVESAQFVLTVRQALNARRRLEETAAPGGPIVLPAGEETHVFHGMVSKN